MVAPGTPKPEACKDWSASAVGRFSNASTCSPAVSSLEEVRVTIARSAYTVTAEMRESTGAAKSPVEQTNRRMDRNGIADEFLLAVIFPPRKVASSCRYWTATVQR